MFKVICVDHVGIACKDLDVSKKFYTEVLGLELSLIHIYYRRVGLSGTVAFFTGLGCLDLFCAASV